MLSGMCDIYLEPSELWIETEHFARTSKKCDGCGGSILSKALYLKHFSKFDGAVFYGKMCGACVSDRQQFADAHGGMLCTPDALRQFIRDCVAEGEDGSEVWEAMLARMDARRMSRDLIC